MSDERRLGSLDLGYKVEIGSNDDNEVVITINDDLMCERGCVTLATIHFTPTDSFYPRELLRRLTSQDGTSALLVIADYLASSDKE